MLVSYKKKILFLLFAILFNYSAIGQDLPPIQNFYPKDYHGENQNWAISQSPNKIIYVANSGGLLEYNGANWKLYPSPNQSIIRSVQVVDNRIYSGCYMEFGYWVKDESGTLNYTSISKLIDVDLLEDEEFWNIINIEDWIVFQSLKRIYIYDLKDNSVNIIESENEINKVFKIDESIYFQRMGKGIYRIDQGIDFLVTDHNITKNNKIINLFLNGKDLLILTEDRGFYSLKDNFLEKSNFASNKILSELIVYQGIRLKNNGFMLGTIAKGLIHISENGELLSQIDQIKGLSNNTVLSLFEDVEENVWLGLDNGISYVNTNSPYRVFNDNKGILGSTYASLVMDEYLYLGTNQGLFSKRFNSDDEFVLIEGTRGQVWALREIDGTLFCGHNSGTFIIDGNKANKISNIQGTWDLTKLDHRDDLILQGNYDGLYILEKLNNVWKFRNKIEGFNNSSRYFEIMGDEIFVNHEYKGIFKLKIDNSFFIVNEISIDSSLKGPNSGIVKYRGELLYASQKGIFKYDSLNQKFLKDSLLSTAYSEDEYGSGKLIVDNKDNVLWIFTKSNISFIMPGGLSNKLKIDNIPLPTEMRAGILGYENISRLENTDEFLIGTTSGYIRVALNKMYLEPFEIKLDHNSFKNTAIKPIKEFQIANSPGEFDSDENDFNFFYYVTEYNRYLATNYQVQLLGMNDNWSSWSEETNTSFENLPPGSYTFNVRAKIGNTVSTNTATYSFEIYKPWYISNLMLSVYALGLVLFAFLTHNMYQKYYHKQKQRLINKNNKELDLIRIQNEKEIIKIKNEQLNKEFKEKSRELATSIMSVIKKNELLTSIKDKLTGIQNENQLKALINIIDKNLKQNDDWEYFQKAFDNADSEFLKNLKAQHGELSPNDLKLCAYLRLNLSTKEIAKLLNITYRSVEIKRYRLRKKLKLQHEDNLVAYILEL